MKVILSPVMSLMVYQARIRSSISLQDMMDRLNMSLAEYVQIEIGERYTDVENIKKIQTILGINLFCA